MRHAIPYTNFPLPPNAAFPNGHVAKRPILRLDLKANGKIVACYAEVDSGADHCAFPLSFAPLLGLDPSTNKSICPVAGVGRGAISHFWNVTMQFGSVLTLNAYVSFTPGLEQQGFGLLGQSGFFDAVKVEFDHRSNLFCIETDDQF